MVVCFFVFFLLFFEEGLIRKAICAEPQKTEEQGTEKKDEGNTNTSNLHRKWPSIKTRKPILSQGFDTYTGAYDRFLRGFASMGNGGKMHPIVEKPSSPGGEPRPGVSKPPVPNPSNGVEAPQMSIQAPPTEASTKGDVNNYEKELSLEKTEQENIYEITPPTGGESEKEEPQTQANEPTETGESHAQGEEDLEKKEPPPREESKQEEKPIQTSESDLEELMHHKPKPEHTPEDKPLPAAEPDMTTIHPKSLKPPESICAAHVRDFLQAHDAALQRALETVRGVTKPQECLNLIAPAKASPAAESFLHLIDIVREVVLSDVTTDALEGSLRTLLSELAKAPPGERHTQEELGAAGQLLKNEISRGDLVKIANENNELSEEVYQVVEAGREKVLLERGKQRLSVLTRDTVNTVEPGLVILMDLCLTQNWNELTKSFPKVEASLRAELNARRLLDSYEAVQKNGRCGLFLRVLEGRGATGLIALTEASGILEATRKSTARPPSIFSDKYMKFGGLLPSEVLRMVEGVHLYRRTYALSNCLEVSLQNIFKESKLWGQFIHDHFIKLKHTEQFTHASLSWGWTCLWALKHAFGWLQHRKCEVVLTKKYAHPDRIVLQDTSIKLRHKLKAQCSALLPERSWPPGYPSVCDKNCWTSAAALYPPPKRQQDDTNRNLIRSFENFGITWASGLEMLAGLMVDVTEGISELESDAQDVSKILRSLEMLECVGEWLLKPLHEKSLELGFGIPNPDRVAGHIVTSMRGLLYSVSEVAAKSLKQKKHSENVAIGVLFKWMACGLGLPLACYLQQIRYFLRMTLEESITHPYSVVLDALGNGIYVRGKYNEAASLLATAVAEFKVQLRLLKQPSGHGETPEATEGGESKVERLAVFYLVLWFLGNKTQQNEQGLLLMQLFLFLIHSGDQQPEVLLLKSIKDACSKTAADVPAGWSINKSQAGRMLLREKFDELRVALTFILYETQALQSAELATRTLTKACLLGEDVMAREHRMLIEEHQCLALYDMALMFLRALFAKRKEPPRKEEVHEVFSFLNEINQVHQKPDLQRLNQIYERYKKTKKVEGWDDPNFPHIPCTWKKNAQLQNRMVAEVTAGKYPKNDFSLWPPRPSVCPASPISLHIELDPSANKGLIQTGPVVDNLWRQTER